MTDVQTCEVGTTLAQHSVKKLYDTISLKVCQFCCGILFRIRKQHEGRAKS